MQRHNNKPDVISTEEFENDRVSLHMTLKNCVLGSIFDTILSLMLA